MAHAIPEEAPEEDSDVGAIGFALEPLAAPLARRPPLPIHRANGSNAEPMAPTSEPYLLSLEVRPQALPRL